MSAPRKHSLTLGGHRTSVSMEDEFWAAFREIAAEKGCKINELAREIDAQRPSGTGLATALRLYVLAYYRARQGAPNGPASGGAPGGTLPPGGSAAGGSGAG